MSKAELNQADQGVDFKPETPNPEKLTKEFITSILAAQAESLAGTRQELTELQAIETNDPSTQAEIDDLQREITSLEAAIQKLQKEKRQIEKEEIETKALASLEAATNIPQSMRPLAQDLLQFYTRNKYTMGDWNTTPHLDMQGKTIPFLGNQPRVFENIKDSQVKEIQEYIQGRQRVPDELDAFSQPYARLGTELNTTLRQMQENLNIIKNPDSTQNEVFYATRELSTLETKRAQTEDSLYKSQIQLSSDPKFLDAYNTMRDIINTAVREVQALD